MKFTRLNDNAIRCLISRQEMDAQGIDINELMDDRAKAEEFLRYILQEARNEVDFVTSGEALNVQMSVMNGGDVSLMISDDQGAAVAAMLAQFKEKLREFQEAIAARGSKEASIIERFSREAQETIARADDDDPLNIEIWAEFGSLDECIRLAGVLADLSDQSSTLFKYHDIYYMKLDLVLTKKQMAHYVFTVAEYSRNMYTDSPYVFGVEEHGKRIITDTAIRDLVQL